MRYPPILIPPFAKSAKDAAPRDSGSLSALEESDISKARCGAPGLSGDWNYPTQAKRRLEWATRPALS